MKALVRKRAPHLIAYEVQSAVHTRNVNIRVKPIQKHVRRRLIVYSETQKVNRQRWCRLNWSSIPFHITRQYYLTILFAYHLQFCDSALGHTEYMTTKLISESVLHISCRSRHCLNGCLIPSMISEYIEVYQLVK